MSRERGMSARFVRAAWAAARAFGGWDGPATRAALARRLAELHALGLTARAAGNVLAREWGLHSSRELAREMAA